MYRLYAIIAVLVIKNCGAAVIHLDNLKFTVNGAPSATQSNNLNNTTTPATVKVYILEDKQVKTQVEDTKSNKTATDVTNSPIVINIPKGPAAVEEKKLTQEDILAKKGKPKHKEVETKTKPQFKVSVLKPLVKEISSNAIETRRMARFNVYVPISEDLIKPDDEVGRGLSLIDLKGNIMRLPL